MPCRLLHPLMALWSKRAITYDARISKQPLCCLAHSGWRERSLLGGEACSVPNLHWAACAGMLHPVPTPFQRTIVPAFVPSHMRRAAVTQSPLRPFVFSRLFSFLSILFLFVFLWLNQALLLPICRLLGCPRND
ncbi:unnamed protein product [Periconia digitata]|uniref:Uncharacterized protein n=1 Tax=Periconia digitata TaxID=1303443 RepID=A0A9W4XMD0_9PLEO|nr:unnamed protein product [Periconia digitata]